MTISFAPRSLTAFLMKVAATGWFTVGLAPMTMITSASSAAENGAETAPEFEPFHQRRDRGGVAQPRAVIDVVGAEAGAHQLLEQIGLFVRALGRAEPGERASPLRVADARQPGGGADRAPPPSSPRGNASRDWPDRPDPSRRLRHAAGASAASSAGADGGCSRSRTGPSRIAACGSPARRGPSHRRCARP